MRHDGNPGRTLLRVVVLVACTGLAAGCATASTNTSVKTPQSAPSSPPNRTTPLLQTPYPVSSSPGPTSPGGQTPRQRADADAAAIFASFAVPPGATKLPGVPSAGQGVLKQPDSTPETPDLVDDAGWWEVPGTPAAVLSWETAHLAHRFSRDGTSSGSDGKVTYWGDEFDLPAVTGVLDSRELQVKAVAAGDGETALRVDAQVTWTPARPASEVVPTATRAVTLSELPNMNSHTKPPAPVTITDPAKVRALEALIDGLPLFPPGTYSCPAAFGDAVVLTFRAKAGGPALAVATIDTSGCEGIDFTIGVKQQPGLGGPGAGDSVAGQAIKIAGLNWKLPAFGLP